MPVLQHQSPFEPLWQLSSETVCNMKYIANRKKNTLWQRLNITLFNIAIFTIESIAQIYTDGSKLYNGVGCAAISEAFSVTKKLPISCSIFSAELYAIILQLR